MLLSSGGFTIGLSLLYDDARSYTRRVFSITRDVAPTNLLWSFQCNPPNISAAYLTYSILNDIAILRFSKSDFIQEDPIQRSWPLLCILFY